MTHRFILLTHLLGLLLWSGTIANAQSEDIYTVHWYVDNQDSLPYRMLYPADYDRNQRYPLVLFLHGAGERGSDNQKQLTHGASLFLTPSHRERFPCIVVFPQCPEDDYWSSVDIDREQRPFALDFDYNRPAQRPLEMALQLTDQIISREAIDTQRIYIMGLSMGGMGTFEAIYHRPDFFAAAVPICGGGDALAYHEKSVNQPFWIFHGAEDNVVGVEHSITMYDRIIDLGGQASYT
jgi:predicted peptidase